MAMQSQVFIRGICRSVRNLQTPFCHQLPGKLSRHSSSTSNGLGKLYELRVYQIWPKDMKPFIELSKEWIHLRTAHSPLIGYWVSEIGGINDVVHIWEYDNLTQRAAVRQALAGDSHWINSYFSKILPMMSRQENMLLQTVGDSSLVQPDLKGVYELDTIKQGAGLKFSSDKGNAKLLGTFQSVLGPTNTGYQLWFHNSLQQAVENQIKGDNSDDQATGGHRRLLIPTPWSPLQ
ncbi:protein NipSnap homolog 3A-like [Ylistrum balloti]|uniref:protein NipSnap homolog 3A-like n=1 Tax=Ylistrum balloti TaxID=509963 RepID=UPI002905BC68|nr:protein NipSnap homolog 3A-like [Ylistrum balloti]